MAADSYSDLLAPAPVSDPFATPPPIDMSPVAAPTVRGAPKGASAAAPAPNPAGKQTMALDPDLAEMLTAADKDQKDLENNPDYKRNLMRQQLGLDKIQSSAEKGDKEASALADMGPRPAHQKFTEAEPDFHEYSVKALPFLLMATALGGRVAKVSGQGMLNAMTGMIQGSQQGSKEAYDRAYRQWTDHYKKFEDEQKAADELYDNALKWNKDKMQARRQASEMWGELVGAARQENVSLASQYNTVQKAREKISAYNAQVQRNREKADVADKRDAQKYAAMWNKSSELLARPVQGAIAAKEATRLLPEVVKAIQDNHIPYPKSWLDMNTMNLPSDMPEQQKQAIRRFVSMVREAKIVAVALDTAGTGRGNMLIQGMAGETLNPNIFAQTPEGLRSLITNTNQMLDNYAKQSIDKVAAFRATAQQKDPSLQLPDFESYYRDQLEKGYRGEPSDAGQPSAGKDFSHLWSN